ncbi:MULTISPECIES: hypothetical protein [Neisseria]|jgi:hypothetical protein|nr:MULTISPECIES: hypothetical protein [Neisseria]MDU1533926.1 hypothetical protein [Neisseria sp.]
MAESSQNIAEVSALQAVRTARRASHSFFPEASNNFWNGLTLHT